MPTTLAEELKAFERDLAKVIAKFMILYDRVEQEVRRPGPSPMPTRASRQEGTPKLEPIVGYH